MEDRSLDEFLDDGDESAKREESAEREGSAAAPAPEEPDPPTSRWVPDGEACAACGDTVKRLWLDEGQRVCGECKNW